MNRPNWMLWNCAAVIMFFACSSGANAEDKTATPSMDFRISGQAESIPNRLDPVHYTKGHSLSITICGADAAQVASIKFEETERDSRIVADIKKLIGKLAAAAAAGDATCTASATHVLQYKRSSLKITAIDNADKEVASKTVVVGPEEHLYISLDLPVSNRSTLKYDSTSGKLLPKEDSPQLYAGINYQIGDLLLSDAPEDQKSTTKAYTIDRMSIKTLVQMSSKPLDSIGVGFGYSLPPSSAINLAAVSIFVGHFWSKQDAVIDGVVRKDYEYSGSWRAGVSFSLDEALKWVK